MLLFRELKEQDLGYRVEWMNNPLVYGSMHYQVPITMSGTQNWFQQCISNSARKDFVLENNGTLLAMTGLTGRDNHINKAESYSFVNPNEFQKGFGSLSLLINCIWGFEVWGLRKIWCYIDSYNIQSIKMHSKIGFEIEGELKDETRKGNIYYDRLYLGLFERNLNKNLLKKTDNNIIVDIKL